MSPNSAGHELWVAPADGSGARQISLPGLDPYDATWDPTRPGFLLVRYEDTQTKDVGLYFVDVNGTTPTVEARVPVVGRNLYGPTWEFSGLSFSPDGATIAYNSVEGEADGEHFWAHLINRDGTNNRLVPLPEKLPKLYSQAWSAFSPDGKWIAMESWWPKVVGGDAVNQIALAPSDGSAPARPIGPVIDGSSLIRFWTPDGTRVVACAPDLLQMYTIDPVSGSSERLPFTDCPGWQRVAK